ncbi:MAG: NAD(P)H-binding protein, partial [Actinomycetota bacterium]
MRVLVTGATGYIGGRLVPRLLDRGHDVRCMTRDPEQLTLDPWRDQVDVVAADALDPSTLDAALADCDAAYFLIHAMKGSPRTFAEQGRRAAANFREAADRAGLRHIIYLGGLGADGHALSEHLDSRQEVGRELAGGRTPVTELRAAVIIGSGSMSFEMIRHLTEVLPVFMTPRWVETRCQPIAIRDVLEILVSVLESPDPSGRIFDIGGPDVFTYEQMMQIYADVAGLRRRMVIPLPVFSTRLSPVLVGLVTPLPVDVARPLIESL